MYEFIKFAWSFCSSLALIYLIIKWFLFEPYTTRAMLAQILSIFIT
ncbi:hypothetical protein [Desulfovibrio inopinatus]|nr:hypothetical protein [Desulfovibrio inopinatus]